MGEHFLEDREEEFPVNSSVHCGQTPYRVGFEGATIEDAPTRSHRQPSPGRSRNTFLPKVIVRTKK